MKVAPDGHESKHLFEMVIDNEQVFVVGCRHDEQAFDDPQHSRTGRCGVTGDTYNFDDGDDRDRKDIPMTALLTATLPEYLDDEPVYPGRPRLRLVEAPAQRGLRLRPVAGTDDESEARLLRPPRRRVSADVRRRRTLLAMMGLSLAVLASPLGGFGGVSTPPNPPWRPKANTAPTRWRPVTLCGRSPSGWTRTGILGRLFRSWPPNWVPIE